MLTSQDILASPLVLLSFLIGSSALNSFIDVLLFYKKSSSRKKPLLKYQRSQDILASLRVLLSFLVGSSTLWHLILWVVIPAKPVLSKAEGAGIQFVNGMDWIPHQSGTTSIHKLKCRKVVVPWTVLLMYWFYEKSSSQEKPLLKYQRSQDILALLLSSLYVL